MLSSYNSGVRNLYKYLKIYANVEPVLVEDDIFRVEIPIDSIGTIETGNVPINTDKREEIILSFIRENGSISNKEAAIKKTFKRMAENGRIVPVGERKNRRYVLNST